MTDEKSALMAEPAPSPSTSTRPKRPKPEVRGCMFCGFLAKVWRGLAICPRCL